MRAVLGFIWAVVGLAGLARGQETALPAIAPVIVQAIGLTGGAAVRQEAAMSEGVAGGLATLHVYMNLMQVPTLVLTPEHERMARPVPEASFRIRRDGGPAFKPTHVKREGNDPISLAVLIDVTNAKNPLLSGLADAVAQLAPTALKQEDHISLYVMACGLVRTAYDVPVTEASLRGAMERAADWWKSHPEGKSGQRCAAPIHLWDAMSFATRQLYRTTGRKVLLVLSDGTDRGSKTSPAELTRLEQKTTTAVFGLMTPDDMTRGRPQVLAYSDIGLLAKSVPDLPDPKDPFNLVCEASGGVELAATRKTLAGSLVDFVQMLRERYIVEYPRADDEAAGDHTIEILIGRRDAYVRSSGIEVPLADAKALADPNTLKSGSVPK